MMERQLGAHGPAHRRPARRLADHRNKMELRRTRVLARRRRRNAVETARPAIEAAGHELDRPLPPEPIFLDADLTRLAQVFANLLTNSAKYTEPGGRIWLDRRAARRRGGRHGPRHRHRHPGRRRCRASSTCSARSTAPSSGRTGGLGIGLALVKGLVEMHGGTVAAESAGPGTGQHFTVRLPPWRQRPRRRRVGTGDGRTRARPTRRILVVDDNRRLGRLDGADAQAPGQRGRHRPTTASRRSRRPSGSGPTSS